MKLSTKGRYGARAMLELALNYKKGPVILSDISRRQEISAKYLERIMNLLVSSGLVRSERGKNGGFTLAREPSKITLGQIVRVTEGSLSVVNCVDDKKICKRSGDCVMLQIWSGLTDTINKQLNSITLKDIAEMHLERKTSKKDAMYYI